jgi:protein-disulfide isomerase
MTDHDRLTRLFHEAAEHAAPEPIDLWPAIYARLRPGAALPAPSRRGALTLVAALLIVIVAVLVLVSAGGADDSLHFAGLQQAVTPTVSLEQVPSAQTESGGDDMLIGTGCMMIAFSESMPLYHQPDPTSKVIYRIPENTILGIGETSEIDGITWMEVSTPLAGGYFTGWVQVTASQLDQIRACTGAQSTPAVYLTHDCDPFVVVKMGNKNASVYTDPDENSKRLYLTLPNHPMMVTRERYVDGETWYQVHFTVVTGDIDGWVRADGVTQGYRCPTDGGQTVMQYQISTPGAALCEDYPQYCVPLVGGGTTDSTLALVEAPSPERAAHPGVVRGLTADGVPFIGNPDAPVRFEVVQDLTCIHCTEFHHDLQRFIQDYVLTGQALLQSRLYAGIEPDSEIATQAAFCAGEQGAFWEMTDALLALVQETGDVTAAYTLPQINATAANLELDADALEMCIESEWFLPVLDTNRQVAADRGITGGPTVLMNDSKSDAWQRVENSYDTLASFTESFNANPGISLPNPVYITTENFTDGAFMFSGELTNTQPRADFALIDGFGALYDALDAAEGWVLLSVDGFFYTPDLYVDQVANDWGDGGLLNHYRTSDGAILFHWLNNAAPGDQRQYHQVYYNFVVDGHRTSLLGDYTLALRPLTDVIELADRPREVVISGGEPQVFRFDTPETQQLRLTIEVTQSMSMEQSLSSTYTLIPDLALILPHGDTLTTFNPGQTQHLVLDFMPPPEGQQYLVINPLDVCQSFPTSPSPNSTVTRAPCPDESSEIRLRVTLEPVEASATGASTAPATPTPLEGTILLPHGTVAVSLPSGSYTVSDGDPNGYVGQYVDLYLSVVVIDLDEEGTSGDALTFPGIIQIVPGEEVQIVTIPQEEQAGEVITERTFVNALVVSTGPYLAPFSNDDPALRWETDQEEWGAITLAVSPQDAVALNWALDAQLPIRIEPAEEPPTVAIAYSPKAGDEFGVRTGDTVDIILAANQIRFDGQTVQGHILPTGDTDSPRYTLHGVKVTGIQVGVLNLELPPLEAAILQWAIDEEVPLTFVSSEE